MLSPSLSSFKTLMNTDNPEPSSWFQQLLKWIPQKKPTDKTELLSVIQQAEKQNILTTESLTMIEGALQVADMHVRDVMVPRAQMVVLALDDPPDKLIQTIVASGHSRFPVVGESRDDVQGIFLAKDLLDYYARNDQTEFNMRDGMRPAIFIPESKRLNTLLKEFRTSRNHIAIVVDEYSGVAGLVTIEDVIEQIVGDIDDEHDIEEQDYIRQRKDGSYIVRALIPIEEFNEYFQSSFRDDEFDTMGGLLMQAFGHLPKKGEQITLDNFHIEVLRASGRRIHLFKVMQEMPINNEATNE